MLLKVYREELLLRIMTNLLDNSRKYRNKDIGHCVVSVSREENRARIEFAGDGPGVDYECLGKLFDIFYRTDKARSNTGTGSGIGLAFVRKAVTRLMDRHYSLVFHGIIGIVIAATAMIIPFGSFASGIKSCAADIICLAVGIAAALLLTGSTESSTQTKTNSFPQYNISRRELLYSMRLMPFYYIIKSL